MKTLAVFDLDGTLIDSISDIANAVNHVRRAAGMSELDIPFVTKCVGNGAELLIKRTIPEENLEFSCALKTFKEYYQEHTIDTTKCYDKVSEGLATLKDAGITLAVVSNKPTTACFNVLQNLGIADFFTEIIGGDSGFPLKPEPDALLFLKNKYQTVANFMCGDHYTDLAAGSNANFKRIYASYGFGDPRDEKSDFTANHFNEVCRLILDNCK